MKKITVIRNKEIHERFKSLKKNGMDDKTAVSTIAEEKNDIGKLYVRNILKECGIKVVGTREKNNQRDSEIIERYMAGKDHADISEEFGLTTTRIGQIIRASLGKYAKNSMLETTLVELKQDINKGMPHKDVQDKYGASTLRKIKCNLGYNAFDACLEKRNRDILVQYKEKSKSAAEIAKIFGLTRDHVYGILHESGIRTKPTKKQYKDRNKEILTAFHTGKTSQEIAEEHEMTVTNVNIILKNHGARKKSRR